MAISSMATSLFSPLPILNSCNSAQTKLSPLPLPRISLVLKPPKPLLSASTSVFASSEVIDPQETLNDPQVLSSSMVLGDETLVASPRSIDADSEKMAPKQKIRIKLRSYWVALIEESSKLIMDAARTTNARTVGPVPLPTKRRLYCILKSPHVHKDARLHFEIRTHQRLIDIIYPTAQTIDSLMKLDFPAGVDVEVKL